MNWNQLFTIFLQYWDRVARVWQCPLRLLDKAMDVFGKALTWVVALIMGLFPGLDPVMSSQIAGSVGYAPWVIVSIPLRRQVSEEAQAAMDKLGGFMRGICHAHDDFALQKEANIEWERIDIPVPYEADGVTLSQGYKDKKALLIKRKKAGLKNLVVTDYPMAFLKIGMDPRTPEGLAKIAAATKFLVEDLKPYIGAVQVTNEMGIGRFMDPLTIEESARYIGEQLKAVYPIKGDVLVGYNSAGPQMDLNSIMKRDYLQYFDYYGLDIYLGCFFGFPSYMQVFDLALEAMWSYLQKPVIMAEFGYLSAGAPKTTAEKNALLMERYGFADEAAVRANPEGFLVALEKYSPLMGSYVRRHAGDSLEAFLFGVDFRTHLYCELPEDYVIPGYPHTPEGQAKFYENAIPRFAKYPFVIGAFVYAWQDAERCYACGQADCPQETGWGLLDGQGNKKPAFEAVKEAFGNLK